MLELVSGPSSLHRVIYASRATGKIYPDQSECITHILKVATANNQKMNVTGALLACDDWFVQALEGRRIDVDVLLARIAADESHDCLRKIASGPIPQRSFSQWSMCASILSPTDRSIVDVLHTRGPFDASGLTQASAMQLLMAVARLQQADRQPQEERTPA